MQGILFDGWPLVYEPAGSQALHLLTLLSAAPGARRIIALPGSHADIPPDVETAVQISRPTPYRRLVWEQRILPSIFLRSGCYLLVTTGSGIPIRLARNTLLSPASLEGFPWQPDEPNPPAGLWERMRRSMAAGALSQVKTLLWPEDLPPPEGSGQGISLVRLPIATHPNFLPANLRRNGNQHIPELPEAFVLLGGPLTESNLERALAAWSWASGALGETTHLVIPSAPEHWAQEHLAKAGLQKTVTFIAPKNIQDLAAMFQGMNALFEIAKPVPWGSALRHAIACGKPAAAAGYDWTKAIAGPAAYLAPPEDTRLLGAAVLTLLVEESVAEQLSQAANERAASWRGSGFAGALQEIILGNP